MNRDASRDISKIPHGFKNAVRTAMYSVFVLALIFYIIAYPEKSVEFVIKALNLCYIIIIPAIFPFLIFSKMLFGAPPMKFMSKALDKPAKLLFDISGEYTNAFLVGSIAGFPIGAKSVADIYSANPHTKNEAERTLAFCNNCSMPFVLAAVGVGVFGSSGIGMLLFFTQLASAIITGVITKFLFGRKKYGKFMSENKIKTDVKKDNVNNNNINNADKTDITAIISEAVTAMLNICGIIIFFSIVINIMLEIFNLLPPVSGNAALHTAVKIIAPGFLEISSGVYSLANIDLSFSQKIICASAVLAWSGLSVHFQIIYVLKNTGLSLKPYFTGKIIHVIISTIFIKILTGFENVARMCYIEYAPSPVLSGGYEFYMSSLIATLIVTLITLAVIAAIALICRLYVKIKTAN